jgi:phosphoglycolate phosphatase
MMALAAARYVIFDLDDTLVHSDAVRAAFARAGREHAVDADAFARELDGTPGRRAREVFEAAGLDAATARAAEERFVALLAEIDEQYPAVAYPDADDTLRALASHGSTLMLATGSPQERAQAVIRRHGWEHFAAVVGSAPGKRKGPEQYATLDRHAGDPGWRLRAATVGDRPEDMRLGAEHGVAVRIGVERHGDGERLRAAGATHVVAALADVLPILAAL